jgi:hypothetical protein
MRPMPMDDPRDNLERATRWELYDFAKQVGCSEVKEPMPALLAAQILRAKGHTNIRTSVPPLGSMPVLGKDYGPADKTVDAVSDLARQYEQEQAAPAIVETVDVDSMNINQLRTEAKRRGIKLSRKDTMDVLKAKLNGENPP